MKIIQIRIALDKTSPNESFNKSSPFLESPSYFTEHLKTIELQILEGQLECPLECQFIFKKVKTFTSTDIKDIK